MKHLKKFNESKEEFQLIDLVDYLQDLMDHYDIYLHGDGDEISMQDIIDNNEIDDFDKNDFQIIIPINNFDDLEKVYYHMKSVIGHMKSNGYHLSYFEIDTDTNGDDAKITSTSYSFYK
jgi:hypothetical protein